jgi:transposase-like protein
MYSLKEKKRAIELYLKYDKSCAAVIHEIGYPCRVQLLAWYRDYEKTGGSSTRTGIGATATSRNALPSIITSHMVAAMPEREGLLGIRAKKSFLPG